MTDAWSRDARVLVRPAREFRSLAGPGNLAAARPTFWVAARRPLFLTLVLASVVSLLGTGVAAVRLVAPTAIYWSVVPVVEILALASVLGRRWRSRGLPLLIDAFFAGHAAWTLFLLALGAAVAMTPPQHWWFLLVGPGLAGMVIVAGWSAYIDVCFFRYVCGAKLARAVGDAVLYRLIGWTLIFWVFAVPEPTPFGVIQEIAEAVAEVWK